MSANRDPHAVARLLVAQCDPLELQKFAQRLESLWADAVVPVDRKQQKHSEGITALNADGSLLERDPGWTPAPAQVFALLKNSLTSLPDEARLQVREGILLCGGRKNFSAVLRRELADRAELARKELLLASGTVPKRKRARARARRGAGRVGAPPAADSAVDPELDTQTRVIRDGTTSDTLDLSHQSSVTAPLAVGGLETASKPDRLDVVMVQDKATQEVVADDDDDSVWQEAKSGRARQRPVSKNATQMFGTNPRTMTAVADKRALSEGLHQGARQPSLKGSEKQVSRCEPEKVKQNIWLNAPSQLATPPTTQGARANVGAVPARQQMVTGFDGGDLQGLRSAQRELLRAHAEALRQTVVAEQQRNRVERRASLRKRASEVERELSELHMREAVLKHQLLILRHELEELSQSTMYEFADIQW